MAKSKGKHRHKSKRDVGGGGAFLAQLLRETVGNFAGQLIADGAEEMAKGARRRGGDDHRQPGDVAADVLCALVGSAPKSIAELVTETGSGLTPLLHALQQTREFGLIELIGDDGAVQLTPAGSRTAAAVRRDQINSDGMKLLGS